MCGLGGGRVRFRCHAAAAGGVRKQPPAPCTGAETPAPHAPHAPTPLLFRFAVRGLLQERVRVCQLCINSFANVGSPAQTGQGSVRKLLLRHAPNSPVVAAMSPATRGAAAQRCRTPASQSQAAAAAAAPGSGRARAGSHASDDGARNVFEEPSVKTQLAYGRQLFASPLAGPRRASITKLDPHMSPLWVPDQLVSECAHCASAFSLFNRKHHCRQCGNVFWCVATCVCHFHCHCHFPQCCSITY